MGHQPISRLEQSCKVPSNSNLEAQLGEGSQAVGPPHHETSNCRFGGSCLKPQDTNWYHHQFACSSGFPFFTMLFVSPCESQDFPDLQGLRKFQDPLLIQGAAWLAGNNWCAYRQTSHPGRVQAWLEVGQRPAVLLLKAEQDYLHFTFPNSLRHSYLIMRGDWKVVHTVW